MEQRVFKANIAGREEVEILVNANGTLEKLTGIGDLKFLRHIKQFEMEHKGKLMSQLRLPSGPSLADHLLRESLMKSRGEWVLPFEGEELCHCRGIPRDRVIASIYLGATSPEKISRWTSASTACGTCRPDVESLIHFFLDLIEGRGSSGKDRNS